MDQDDPREPTYDELRDALREIRDRARRTSKNLTVGPPPRHGVSALHDIALEADAVLGENTAYDPIPEEK